VTLFRNSVRDWNTARWRGVILQGLGLGICAVALWWLARNTASNLDQRGISVGFEFLRQPANFAIGEAWVRYSPDDTLARAILVGLANTAIVSVLGWMLATVFGFVVGLLRLSRNPVLDGLLRGAVDFVRNIPLLLLLLFLAATMHSLPSPRNALEPVSGVILSDRGLILAYPGLTTLHAVLALVLVGTLLLRTRLGRRGWWVVAGAAGALAVALSIVPPSWRSPHLEGFNFVGGVTFSPEFAALLFALVLHHGAHISEVVRGAVLAVPQRQWDAAAALGLSRFQATRLVVLPQAIRAMVPLLANNCVSLTKNSSLAVAIGFPDVVSVLNTTANQTGHAVETMLIMILVYLALSLAVAAALNSYNRRILRHGVAG